MAIKDICRKHGISDATYYNGNNGEAYQLFVEATIGRNLDNPTKNVCGSMIFGRVRVIKEALRRISHKRCYIK